MQQDYFVYIHERDRYDFYMLHDVVRTASPYFIIDFEEAAEVFRFLDAVQDGLYPQLVVTDLYDAQQAQAISNKAGQLLKAPFIPVWILADALPEDVAHQNGVFLKRPQHREGWEALAHRILKHISGRHV